MASVIRKLPFSKPPKLQVPRFPQDTGEPEVFEEMTLQEHLEELRDRILRVVMAIAPAFLLGFFLSEYIIGDISRKAQTVGGLDVLAPTEPLTLSFKIALYTAIAICMPIIVYQFVAFLSPGMTSKEKRILFTAMPFMVTLFVIGAWYAYFVAAPRALDFLSSWNSQSMYWSPNANETVSFFMALTLGLGVAFQLPVIMFITSKIGVITPTQMRKARKWAFLGILVAAAIITPTHDPLNLMMVAVPVYGLYELGILVAAMFAFNGTRRSRVSGQGDGNDRAIEKADNV
jgi:sec-independent protein translocase protein TatC